MRLLAIGLVVLMACSADRPIEVARPFELRAQTPSGAALAGVRAWLDGAPLGETASGGVFVSRIP